MKKMILHSVEALAVALLMLAFVACNKDDGKPRHEATVYEVHANYTNSKTWLIYSGYNRMTGYVLNKVGDNVYLGSNSNSIHYLTAHFKTEEGAKLSGVSVGDKITFDGYNDGTEYNGGQEIVKSIRCKIVNIDSTEKTLEAERKKTEADTFNALSDAEHIAEARKIIRDRINTHLLTQALVHIQALSNNHPQKKTLEAEYERREKQIKLETDIYNRQDYARKLRTRFLDNGMNIKVSTSGAQHETIRMEYVLFDDVSVHMIRRDNMLGPVGSLGFKKVILTDGYGKTWTTTYSK
jgi:hypothetical protein